MTRVFLDANVYFAGVLSKAGASAAVLELARRGRTVLVASRLVLVEADRNLRQESTPDVFRAFHEYLRRVKIQVLPAAPDEAVKRCEALIHPKDVPVLAAAQEARVDYLLTLDRRHFLTPRVLSGAGKMKILTPGDFLKRFLG